MVSNLRKQMLLDSIELKARRKKLPKFQPYDLGSVENLEIDAELVQKIRQRNRNQMVKLLRALHVDPSLSDAWERGFYKLAFYHHGVGQLAWRTPRTNRNAATWTQDDDLILLDEVYKLRAKGYSSLGAIKRIASDPGVKQLLPYRARQDRSDFQSSNKNKLKKRKLALWRRFQHIKARLIDDWHQAQLVGFEK
jgi:hypothetical protein